MREYGRRELDHTPKERPVVYQMVADERTGASQGSVWDNLVRWFYLFSLPVLEIQSPTYAEGRQTLADILRARAQARDGHLYRVWLDADGTVWGYRTGEIK